MRSIALAASVVAALLVCPQVAAASTWQWPVEGRVITPYRNGVDPYAGGQHRGVDIAAPVGARVVAAAGGTVTFAGLAGSSGLTVAVRTADGYDTSYLHLSAVRVRAGDRVDAGAELGAVGTTGRRSAAQPHLHFGVREAGSRFAYRDPLDFLPPPAATGPLPKAVPVPVAVPLVPRSEPVAPPAGLPAVPVAGVMGELGLPALGPHLAPGHTAGTHATGPTVAVPPFAAAAAHLHAGGSPHAAGAVAPGHAHGAGGARRAPHTGHGAPRVGARGHAVSAAAPAPAAGPASAHAEPPVVAPRRGHHARGSQASPGDGRGIDLGWLAACVGMVAAAVLLGRPRETTRSLRRAFAFGPPVAQSPKPDRS